MEAAIRAAAEQDAEIALIDDPISETIEALADRLGPGSVIKMVTRFQLQGPSGRLAQFEAMTLPFKRVESGEDVQPAVEYMRRFFPEIGEVLIDQRDERMAQRLHKLRNDGYDVVAVVGAGHHLGIQKKLEHLDRAGAEPGITVPIRSPRIRVTEIPVE